MFVCYLTCLPPTNQHQSDHSVIPYHNLNKYDTSSKKKQTKSLVFCFRSQCVLFSSIMFIGNHYNEQMLARQKVIVQGGVSPMAQVQGLVYGHLGKVGLMLVRFAVRCISIYCTYDFMRSRNMSNTSDCRIELLLTFTGLFG